MTTTREKIEVMEASERGEEIELRDAEGAAPWSAAPTNIIWNWGFYDYRVKPKPEPLLEGWMNVYGDGCWSLLHNTLEQAANFLVKSGSTVHGRTVHMREVREDDSL